MQPKYLRCFWGSPAEVLNTPIRFCIENNIPIPTRAGKAPEVVDGQLALDIRLS